MTNPTPTTPMCSPARLTAPNRRRRAAGAVAVLLCCCAGALAQPGGGGGHDANRILGQFVVKMVPGEPIEPVLAAIPADYTPALIRRADELNLYILSFTCPDPDDDDFGCDSDVEIIISALPQVRWVEDNLEFLLPEPAQTQSFFLRQVNPSNFTDQYAVSLLGLPTAHTWSRGAGTVVAVLDTGVDPTHPALSGRVLDGLNFIDPLPPGSPFNTDTADRSFGHGTMVSGLVALVAPEAQILPVKVLDDAGMGDTLSLAQGIRYAVARGATVINMSIAAPTASREVTRALADAAAAGVTLVAAVGNGGVLVTAAAPGDDSHVICVAATDSLDQRAPFSDYAGFVSLSAPGLDVVGCRNDGAFAAGSGTSYASPLVAGAAALIKARRPWLSPVEVADLLRATAAPVADLPGLLGTGRLDLTVASCPLDFTGDGIVNPDDLADYVAAYFGELPLAPWTDFNADGATDPDDLSDVITAYFDQSNGCPR